MAAPLLIVITYLQDDRLVLLLGRVPNLDSASVADVFVAVVVLGREAEGPIRMRNGFLSPLTSRVMNTLYECMSLRK